MATSSPHLSNLALAKRRVEILNNGDFANLEQVLDEDYVAIMPQSGEVIRGIDNLRGTLEHYPGVEGGFAPGAIVDAHVVEPESHDTLVPTFTMSPMPGYHLIHIEDQGDTFTSYATASYPDGSEWYVISIATLRNHRILTETEFFAPRFDPPAWRAQWVELTES